MQLLKLKHKIRELDKLKHTIKNTKDNNELIKRIQSEKNIKVRHFFGKY